jgi:hypothetical protein
MNNAEELNNLIDHWDNPKLIASKINPVPSHQDYPRLADVTFDPILSAQVAERVSPILGSSTMFHRLATPEGKALSGATVVFEHGPLWSGRHQISVWLSDGFVTN